MYKSRSQIKQRRLELLMKSLVSSDVLLPLNGCDFGRISCLLWWFLTPMRRRNNAEEALDN